MVAHTCNPCFSGDWDTRIIWTQEAKIAVSWDCTIALQPGQQQGNSVSKKRKSNSSQAPSGVFPAAPSLPASPHISGPLPWGHPQKQLHSSWWAEPDPPVWGKQNARLMRNPWRTASESRSHTVPCTERKGLGWATSLGARSSILPTRKAFSFSIQPHHCLWHNAVQWPPLQHTRPSPVFWEQLRY